MAIARGHRPLNPAYGFYGVPYFYSDYYDPYEVEYAPPEPPLPPAPAAQVKAEPLPDPVLLELHGSHWVRVTNFGEASDRALNGGAASVTQAAAKPLPPAVLVFRDGHTEEVSSYSIIGRSIYVKADYWSTDRWQRTIRIADLNIPATMKQNQQRGVHFELPSSPDEVMIRP
jgi:hypothetical protein